MAEGLSDSLMRQLIEGFEVEARERLQALNEHLLALEQGPDSPEAPALLKAIFREAHTLKGTAAGLGLHDVESIGHRLETLFGRFQSGELAPRIEVFDRIYQSLDDIGMLVREAALSEPRPAGFDLAGINADLDAIAEGRVPSKSAAASPPASSASEPELATMLRAEDDEPEATPRSTDLEASTGVWPAPDQADTGPIAEPTPGPTSADTDETTEEDAPSHGLTSDDQALMRRLLDSFDVEARERLRAMDDHLLAIERGGDDASGLDAGARLDAMRREAHTLKGTARGLGLDAIEGLAHGLEGALGRLPAAIRPEAPADVRAACFQALYEGVDALGALTREAVEGVPASAVDLRKVASRLDEAGHAPATQPAPTPTPTPTAPAISISTAPVAPAGVEGAPAAEPPHEPAFDRLAVAAAASPSSEPTAEVPAPTSAPAPAPSKPAEAAKAVEETVRVAVSKLDALMAQVGELQVTRIAAEQRLAEISALAEELEGWEGLWRKAKPELRRAQGILKKQPASEGRTLGAVSELLGANHERLAAATVEVGELRRRVLADGRHMTQALADLQDEVRRVRMRPISTVFEVFPRMVRDIARSLGKEVSLEITGGENELDRSVIEQVHGPLVHLIRNCVDHGLETPEKREAAGKPRRGTIRLGAAQRGASILVEIVDDGAGIDVNRVRAAAVRHGVIAPESAQSMSDHDALWLIFRSGMSTKTEVTDLSGRGVGLDVVRENVEKLGGLIDVETKMGQGTRFSVSLPLTVATTLCLLAESAGKVFAVPVHNVIRLVRLLPEHVGTAGGREVVRVDGRPLPVVRMSDALGIPDVPRPDGPRLAIILGSAEVRIAFEVDAVQGAQEVVIKGLPRPLSRVNRVAGATILGDGQVVVILNASDLIRHASGAGGRPGAGVRAVGKAKEPAAKARRRVMVADDSFTTRSMIETILDSAGFEVKVAADGEEAWTLLQEFPCDLLVTDVEMPRLDGFGLTERVRGNATFKDLPVVLVTSLGAGEDRERGMRAGADAYIIKGSFDQESLLSTIRRLI
ncbi:hybrid sensor histidine kinase/response regulator [Isosphaeraceae bacterium EP7]